MDDDIDAPPVTQTVRRILSVALKRELDRCRRIRDIEGHERRFRTATVYHCAHPANMVYMEVDRVDAPTLLQAMTNSTMLTRTAVHHCIQWYSDLLDSVDILQMHGVTPVQICADNVIICDGFPVLTDFSETDMGICCNNSNNNTSNAIPSRPMEMHLLSFANRRKLAALSLSNIEDVVDEVMGDTIAATDYTWRAEVVAYFFKFVNRPVGQLCGPHLDPELFAVSAMFLPLVAVICTRSDAAPFRPVLVILSEILRDGCHPVPERRAFRTQIRHRLNMVMGRTL